MTSPPPADDFAEFAPPEAGAIDAALFDCSNDSPTQWDRLAAQALLGLLSPEPLPALPPDVRERLLARAHATPPPQPLVPRAPQFQPTWAVWGLAASLFVAVGAWWYGQPASNRSAPVGTTLVGTKADKARVIGLQPCDATLHPHLTGSLNWDDARQQGELRVTGLPLPGPRQQYQLWLVDTQAGPPRFVDGGTFDVSPAGGVRTLIDAPRQTVERIEGAVLTLGPIGGVGQPQRGQVIAVSQ
jgi:hypothetical protein